MQPRADSPGAGLGLPLIASLADTFSVAVPPRGRHRGLDDVPAARAQRGITLSRSPARSTRCGCPRRAQAATNASGGAVLNANSSKCIGTASRRRSRARAPPPRRPTGCRRPAAPGARPLIGSSATSIPPTAAARRARPSRRRGSCRPRGRARTGRSARHSPGAASARVVALDLVVRGRDGREREPGDLDGLAVVDPQRPSVHARRSITSSRCASGATIATSARHQRPQRVGVQVVGVRVRGRHHIDEPQLRLHDELGHPLVRLVGVRVLAGERVRQVRVEQQMPALPGDQEAALAQPPQVQRAGIRLRTSSSSASPDCSGRITDPQVYRSPGMGDDAITFTGEVLDRVAEHRGDPDWLAAQAADPAARAVVASDAGIHVTGDEPRLALVPLAPRRHRAAAAGDRRRGPRVRRRDRAPADRRRQGR